MNRVTFDFGCRLALLATHLDEGKPDLPPELHDDTLACVARMHALAKALLGEFAAEFYDETIEGEESSDPEEPLDREVLNEA